MRRDVKSGWTGLKEERLAGRHRLSEIKVQFNLSKPVAGERSLGVIRVEVAETGDKSGVLLVVDESEENGCAWEETGEFKLRKRNICSTC
jgi:hypothetical protein